MTNLIQATKEVAALRELFSGFGDNRDLSDGVRAPVKLLTFRGKVWRIVAGGREEMLLSDTGDPVPSLMAVIVKASPMITKAYYDRPYVEGADDAPVCASSDGVRPDAGVPKPQAESCAACKWNVFGSRVSADGMSKGKACTDSRRLAIVPLAALERPVSEIDPLLLRMPPTSLQSLVKLKAQLDRAGGIPYQAVAVRLSFDPAVAYPRILVEPKMPLTKEQAAKVRDLLHGGYVDHIFDTPVAGERVAGDGPRIEIEDAPRSKPEPEPESEPEPDSAPKAKSTPDIDALLGELDDLLKV